MATWDSWIRAPAFSVTSADGTLGSTRGSLDTVSRAAVSLARGLSTLVDEVVGAKASVGVTFRVGLGLDALMALVSVGAPAGGALSACTTDCTSAAAVGAGAGDGEREGTAGGVADEGSELVSAADGDEGFGALSCIFGSVFARTGVGVVVV